MLDDLKRDLIKRVTAPFVKELTKVIDSEILRLERACDDAITRFCRHVDQSVAKCQCGHYQGHHANRNSTRCLQACECQRFVPYET